MTNGAKALRDLDTAAERSSEESARLFVLSALTHAVLDVADAIREVEEAIAP